MTFRLMGVAVLFLYPLVRSILLLVALACAPLSATAQIALPGAPATAETNDGAAPLLTEPLSQEDANALLSRLSDTEVRALLLEQLNLASTETASGRDTSDFFYHATQGAAAQILAAVQRVPLLLSSQARAFQNFYATHGPSEIVRFIGLFLVTLLAALAVELVFRRVTSAWQIQNDTGMSDDLTLRQTLLRLARRFLREIVAVIVFMLVARQAAVILMDETLYAYAALIGFNLIALPRFALAIGRFLMAPDFPAYRLVHATDDIARKVVRHNVYFGLLIGFSTVIVSFNALNGVPMGETRLGFWLNLAVHVYLAGLLWVYRDAMVAMMRGPGEVTPMEDRVARAFPIFGIVVAFGTWWVVNIVVSYGNFALLVSAPHYKSMALLMFAPAMDTAIRGLVRHLAPPMTGEGPVAERAHQAATRSFIRIGRVIVFSIVVLTIARFWGMDAESIAAAGVGTRLAANVVEFLIILSIGYLVYESVSLWINRKLAAEYTASGYDPDNADFGGDGGGAGGSRLSTVLPLVLMVSRVTIVILFLLLGLSNIGVDTTPLLAGAGIVGLAIGFGAQKLVTDVVSGIFFLVDDAFRTGEYVEIEGTMGTVEKISIRSMQLRHHKGPVHTIPYGEIPKITNFSRDWVIMKLRFTVPFDTDPNKVKKIFKKIGQELLEHEELGPDFLQPFKSQGVLEIDDVGMVIRGKFMAKPGKQFMIRKEIFNRVSAAFAENGIDFARREVRVAIPGLDHASEADLTAEDKAAIAAAASQAAQEQLAEAGASPDAR